jgi:type I site-specific restriction endonuclease
MDKGHLVPRSYQMYVAADLCNHISNGAKRTVMTLGAGQGKTLVYLLVALMLSKDERTKNTFKTFTVLTSSQLLEK